MHDKQNFYIKVDFYCVAFFHHYLFQWDDKLLLFTRSAVHNSCFEFPVTCHHCGYGGQWRQHCPKSTPNFRYITRKVEENEILHEIFRVCIWFLRCISFYILENLLPLVQWGEDKDHRGNILIRGNGKGRHFHQLSCVC